MSVGEWQMVLVPQPAPLQCPVQPCPYCAVALPHNATTDDVLARCKQMTTDTNAELNRIVSSYTRRIGAARHILRLHDTATKLPAAPSMFGPWSRRLWDSGMPCSLCCSLNRDGHGVHS